MLKEVSLSPSVRWLFAKLLYKMVCPSIGPLVHSLVFKEPLMAVYSALLYLHLVLCSPSSSWFSCCKSQASQFHQFSSFSTLQCRPTQHLEGKTIQVCLCECASVCVSVCVSLSLVSLCLIIFVFLHGAIYTACVTPKGPKSKSVTEGQTERLDDRQTNRPTDQHTVL